MYGRIYLKNNINEFINDFKELTPSEKYSVLVNIHSQFYNIELNGIHIEKLKIIDDFIIITIPNNRKITLKLFEDVEIKILSESG